MIDLIEIEPSKYNLKQGQEIPSDILFNFCMGEFITDSEKERKSEVTQNFEHFKDLLVKYDLKIYADLLFCYQDLWFKRKKGIQNFTQTHQKYRQEKLSYYLEVAKALKMLLNIQINNLKGFELSISDFNSKFTIKDARIINTSLEVFKKEFERLKLNETELSREEAYQEIVDCEDSEWLIELEYYDFYDGYHLNKNLISDEILDDYRFVHYKPREITLELIDTVIAEFEGFYNQDNNKSGAKNKNLEIGELAKRLSYLFRLKSFLNQSEISSITKIQLSNESCRFVYDYLKFWNLLYAHVIYPASEKEKRANYVKSLIKSIKEQSNPRFLERIPNYKIIDSALEDKIDLLWEYKLGKINPTEFEHKINTMQ